MNLESIMLFQVMHNWKEDNKTNKIIITLLNIIIKIIFQFLINHKLIIMTKFKGISVRLIMLSMHLIYYKILNRGCKIITTIITLRILNNNTTILIFTRKQTLIINPIINIYHLLLLNNIIIKGKGHMMRLFQIPIQNNTIIKEEGTPLRNRISFQHHIRICLLLNIQYSNNINNNNNNIIHLLINIPINSPLNSSNIINSLINIIISSLLTINMTIINGKTTLNKLKTVLTILTNNSRNLQDLLCLNKIV